MKYISTSSKYSADLRQAVFDCYAPDGTLYVPERMPVIPQAYFNNIDQMSLTEIAYVVANTLMGDRIAAPVLKSAVDETFSFPIPVMNLEGNTYVVELFHGPTLAFKDISAKFMAALMRRHVINITRPITLIVATTGNTGAAIANASGHVDGVEVLILYPRGSMSRSQLAQMGASEHVRVVEVSGDIGQCKEMVRRAITDEALREAITPVAGNTSNILRLLPQISYFFHAYARMRAAGVEGAVDVSVPCGNMSNLVSALMAKRMGLPIEHIVAGCSSNDDLVRVLDGSLPPDMVNHASRPTMARAMDTGYPTNLNRLAAFYGGNICAARADISAFAVSDRDIAATINETLDRTGYMCDPHTAIALTAAARHGGPRPHMVCATAHPAKSLDVMTAVTGRTVELPLQLTRFMSKPVQPVKIAPTYQALKKILIS